MNAPFQIKTDYRLCKAVIEDEKYYDTVENFDHNNYACRILPDMQDFTVIDQLPRFPNFFKNTQSAYNVGDYVWVLTVEDFQVGFILGPAEITDGSREVVNAISLIQEAETNAGFKLSRYNNLSFIVKANDAIEFTDKALGISGMVYSNKLVMMHDSDGTLVVQNRKMKINFTNKGEMIVTGTLGDFEVDSMTINSGSHTETHESYDSKTHGSVGVRAGGTYQVTASGDMSMATLAARNDFTTTTKTEVIGLGEVKTIVAGGSATTVTAGAYALTVAAGALALTAGAGVVTITAGGAITLTAPAITVSTSALYVTSNFLKFPNGATTPNAGGPGPFCGLPFCLFTGVPHTAAVFAGF